MELSIGIVQQELVDLIPQALVLDGAGVPGAEVGVIHGAGL